MTSKTTPRAHERMRQSPRPAIRYSEKARVGCIGWFDTISAMCEGTHHAENFSYQEDDLVRHQTGPKQRFLHKANRKHLYIVLEVIKDMEGMPVGVKCAKEMPIFTLSKSVVTVQSRKCRNKVL